MPVGGRPAVAENQALARLVAAYHADPGLDIVGGVEQFLATHPGSAWRASLRANLGTLQRQRGAFSRALASWEEAWRLVADAETP